ncbi:MAG: hypothetical protein ACSLE7_16905 [Mycobacterium sp.]
MNSDDSAIDHFERMRRQSLEAIESYRTDEQDRRVRAVLSEMNRRACELCDPDGYRPNRLVCDHIDRTESARRGMALIRDVLKLAQLKAQAEESA